MLCELITNNTHNNNTALYKCYNANKVFYRKVAFSHWGNKVIENENKGYEWFYKDSEFLAEIRFMKKYFYELEIPEFYGRKFPSESIFSGNEESIEKIIAFYKGRWSTEKDFTVHGDMALCNFIIDKNGILSNHLIFFSHNLPIECQFIDIISLALGSSEKTDFLNV